MITPQSPIQRLGELSREYERRANAYADVARDAAGNEARYRMLKAQTMLAATQDGASAAKAEIIADANPQVAQACWDYKVSAAVADSARAKLSQLREAVATGRSVLVNERESDRVHAQGMGGAA